MAENFGINYIAFDSFGVKSSCIEIKIGKTSIVIDPGIAAETKTFPLSKTTKLMLVQKYKQAIIKTVNKADIVVISHYHYDHFLPSLTYKNKIMFIKHPEKNINNSQQIRANKLLKSIKPKQLYFADKQKFEFNDFCIEFSKALWHGQRKTKLGYVIMTTIRVFGKNETCVIHSSDIDGPVVEEYADMIISKKPNIIFLDGAPTYLLGYMFSYKNLDKAINNTIKIIKKCDAKIILDHHLVRDKKYKQRYAKVYEIAERLNKKVTTAAEDLGMPAAVLKACK